MDVNCKIETNQTEKCDKIPLKGKGGDENDLSLDFVLT